MVGRAHISTIMVRIMISIVFISIQNIETGGSKGQILILMIFNVFIVILNLKFWIFRLQGGDNGM